MSVEPRYMLRRWGPYGWQYLREDFRWTADKGSGMVTSDREVLEEIRKNRKTGGSGSIVRLIGDGETWA